MAATYPDATTTGVPSDVTLKQSGSLVITTPGAVIEGLDIRGSVVIDAPNVTLKNCKISDGGYNVVLIKPGVTGAVVQNCDIDNQGTGGQGIAGQGTFVSNNIHGCADGIDVRGDNTVIRDNFIHDMQGTSDSHFDSIQADGSFSNLTISHNTIINEQGQTSAVMLDNYWGPIDNVKIDDNLLVGGGYTVYLNEVANGQAGGGPVTNVSLTNNHIVPGHYGDINLRTELGHDPVISGNTNDGDAMLASLQMTGQPSSADAGAASDTGTGVSDPASSTSHDSGTDSHDSGPVASDDQGSVSGGSDGASADPGATSDGSSANAGSSNDAGTGVSDPASPPSQDSHDSGSVASGDQGATSGGSDSASADPGSSTSDGSSANAGSSNDAGTGVSDPASPPSQDSHDSGSVASGDQGATSGDSSANAGSSSDSGTSPSDQSSSTSGSGSHDGHHHGRWHWSSDSASADSDSTDSSGSGSHSHHGHNGHSQWQSDTNASGAESQSATTSKADSSGTSSDSSGTEQTNAAASGWSAGQKYGTSHKAGDGSHGLNHDTFVFGSHFQDMVEKLQQRASDHDFGQFSKNMYDHLADALNLASKAGHDGIHAGASGDTMTFKDAKASNHHHNDFHFS